MGTTTPNIGIYIPAAGETNYDASFAAGMVNIDQHDHSGGPNKGVPIATGGIADGSITYPKLNPNVVDTTTGLGTHTGGLANQIFIKDLLASINALVSNGIIVKSGTNALARTITGTANQIAVTNGDGVSGNPTLALSPIVLNATQPAFSANCAVQNNVTGLTSYTVQFTTVNFNQGSYFDGTSTFTAPVTGIYNFGINLEVSNLVDANKTGIELFVNGVYVQNFVYLNSFPVTAATDEVILCGSQLIKLTATNTVTIKLNVKNTSASDVVNILSGSFTGYLVC